MIKFTKACFQFLNFRMLADITLYEFNSLVHIESDLLLLTTVQPHQSLGLVPPVEFI